MFSRKTALFSFSFKSNPQLLINTFNAMFITLMFVIHTISMMSESHFKPTNKTNRTRTSHAATNCWPMPFLTRSYTQTGRIIQSSSNIGKHSSKDTFTNVAGHLHSTQCSAVIAEVILNCWICHLQQTTRSNTIGSMHLRQNACDSSPLTPTSVRIFNKEKGRLTIKTSVDFISSNSLIKATILFTAL